MKAEHRRLATRVALWLALPLLASEVLAAVVARGSAATVMMGAVAGSSTSVLLAMVLALALRLYVVVVLPGVVVYGIVTFVWSGRRSSAGP